VNYIDVCTGISAASVAWHPLGFTPVAFSEIEKFPCALLKKHYPNVPNYGDMTKFESWPDATADIIIGGTPCQSFSVAGLRKGLADPRGNLMLTYLAIANRYRARWLVWENVPGVLSSDDGNDFRCLLEALAEFGYGFAYRILDAQYFGVAQRRRRVFVVGYFGDWRRAAAVLFERHSLSGHPAPRREARESVAATVTTSTRSNTPRDGLGLIADLSPTLQRREPGYDAESCFGLIAMPHADISPAIKARDSKGASSDGDGDGDGAILIPMAYRTAGDGSVYAEDNITAPLTTGTDPNANIIAGAMPRDVYSGGMSGRVDMAMQGYTQVTPQMRVRRLTPRECERLQGFPDDYTDIYVNRKHGTPDGPRYKALGNSMAVPVIKWIGERIQAVDAIAQKRRDHA
jgi:DNA (cytosine-5)-methyltransferase 1